MRSLLSLLLVCSIFQAHAVTRYVKPLASGTGNGSSWANASANLQAMINASAIGDQVWVAAGTYRPTQDLFGSTTPANPRDRTIRLKAGVHVYGGFAGTEATIGARNLAVNISILSGDLGALNDTSDNAYHVVAHVEDIITSESVTLDGFSITAGNATGAGSVFVNSNFVPQNSGGGLFSGHGVQGVATYRNLRIYNNNAGLEGGGMHLAWGDTALIVRDSIYNNRAGVNGGGAYIGASVADVDSSVFTGNTAATGSGGGVYNFTGWGFFRKSNVFNNTAGASGGGVFVGGHHQTYINNFVYSNTANLHGGGIFVTENWFNNGHRIESNVVYSNTAQNMGGGIYHQSGDLIVINNTIFNNSAQNDGGGLRPIAPTAYHNNIFWQNKRSNSATISGADIATDPPFPIALNVLRNNNMFQLATGFQSVGDTGNIFAFDPLFVNPAQPLGADGIARTADDGLALLTCSPAINEGMDPIPGIPTDMLGNARIGRYDIGAYEFQGTPSPVILVPPISGSTTVCTNATTPYTNPMAGGVWATSDPLVATVSAGGLVVGISAGTATITYTVGSSGCPGSTASQVITVANPPAIAAITGPGTVCQGSTITLGNTTPGGTWSSSNNNVATISSTGDVTGVGAGTTLISYTVFSGCTASVTKPVVVNPLPIVAAITGGNVVCIGSTLQLTNPTPGGTWSTASAGMFSGINSTGLVFPFFVGSDQAIYTVTNAFGCTETRIHSYNIVGNPIVNAITGADTVCMFQTTTFNNTTPLGVWASTNTAIATVSATGVITGVSNGLTSITYTVTNASGCSRTVNKNIYVKTATAVNAINGANGVCVGSTAQYTNSTPGGVWSTVSGGAVASISSTGLLTANAAGTETVRYTVGNPNGCATVATLNVTVGVPVLLPISGPDSVCSGSTGQYLHSTSGGTWSNFNPARGSITGAGVYLAASAGVDTVYYQYTVNGCTMQTKKSIGVKVGAGTVTISGGDSLCKGAVLPLTASVPGGTWSTSNSAVANLHPSAGIIVGTGAGAAVITYTVTTSAGCPGSAIHIIKVNETIASVTQNGNVLTAVSSPGATFQWIDCSNNQPIAGETNITYTATTNGQYAVIADYVGCTDTSACVTVTGVGIGVDKSITPIVISPNPASDFVNINTGNKIATSIKLYDVVGKLIMEVKPADAQTVMNVHDVAKGVYHLHVSFGDEVVVHRLMVQ